MRCKNMETDGSIDSRKKKLSPVIGKAEHFHHDTMLLDTLQLLKKKNLLNGLPSTDFAIFSA
jgi:hypothetical protein